MYLVFYVSCHDDFGVKTAELATIHIITPFVVVSVPNHESGRQMTANTPSFTPLRKSGRPPGPIGQHDYVGSVRKPGPQEFNALQR